jgi:hypothetical protein
VLKAAGPLANATRLSRSTAAQSAVPTDVQRGSAQPRWLEAPATRTNRVVRTPSRFPEFVPPHGSRGSYPLTVSEFVPPQFLEFVAACSLLLRVTLIIDLNLPCVGTTPAAVTAAPWTLEQASYVRCSSPRRSPLPLQPNGLGELLYGPPMFADGLHDRSRRRRVCGAGAPEAGNDAASRPPAQLRPSTKYRTLDRATAMKTLHGCSAPTGRRTPPNGGIRCATHPMHHRKYLVWA